MSERGLELYRRGGGVRRVATWVLLVAPVAMAATVLLGLAAHTDTAALGAGPRLEPLHGRQPQVPPGATLLGPAPSSTVLPLTVTLQPRDPAALAAEAEAVSDPTSADYRHFLTPRQFAQRFGPTPGTVAQVTATLRQAGLTVGSASSTGLSLPVSGTVAQVQSAFVTPIDRYRLSSGKTGYHNRSAPEVPVTVAPEIQGILGLDTLSPPQPTTTLPLPQASATGPGARALGVAPALAPGQPAPQSGSCQTEITGVQTSYGARDAVQLAQAYSFDPLYASSDYGAGTTVALVEMSGAGYSSGDITTFAHCYGITLGSGQVTEKAVAGGGATGGGTVEAELDIDTVLSLAPKANIEVYEGGPTADLYTVFNQIVSDDSAKIVSASWTNGCEAYVGQAYQDSENTLFQAAAVDGQSIFVAAGDQGAEGCNLNGVVAASTGTQPVAQVVDPTTGTLYIANTSSDSLSVDSEGSAGNPSSASAEASVATGTGPDAVALDTTDAKVFVADDSSSSLTTFSTGTCNEGTTSGCAAPTQIASGGHLSSPTAVAVDGSTLYVANSTGTVAVYDASTDAYVATVTLPSPSSPTALAVDAANGWVYVGDAGTANRVDYFNATTCDATVTTGCSTTPATVSVGQDPVSLVVDDASGSLYVANAGAGGGISVVSLGTHALTTTISTGQPSVTGIDGTGLVQSVGLSPGGTQILAVLDGLGFPGDVLATVDPTTQAIVSTVNLETGADTMGALASDGTRDYVWVTDLTGDDDVVQNLNLAVSDPASQPYVTAVGGTSLQGIGPAPTETTWNDQLHYAEGAGGGGISQTFTMPAFQQALGEVTGSSGTPCGNASGDCREVPDVSADADPSTGYVVYDAVNGLGWTAIGGTSGAAPLWAAVLAVAASADANTAGYGALNPILYTLAQKAPGTYLNDVTSGNNDYNAANGGQFAATSGYDMATGLGTPVTSALATGLTMIPVDVAVSGSQSYGGSPTFSATVDFAGSSSLPFGVTLSIAGLSCSEVGTSTPISPSLAAGSHQLNQASCTGASLRGANAADYRVVYTSAVGDFTVAPVPLTVTASNGSMTYGSTPPAVLPTYSGFVNGDSASSLTTKPTCSTTATSSSPVVGSPYPSSCSGAVDPNYVVTYAPGDMSVTGAPLTVSASSGSMTYGGTPPAVIPAYSGFVNGDTPLSLTTTPTCSTTATSSSPASPPTYPSTCSGAVDSNYAITYAAGAVTINRAPLTVTASSGSMTYGGTPPAILPTYSGFVNGDGVSSLTTKPTCSTTATSASPVPGSPYASSCTGAVDANYTVTYAAGAVTVNRAPLTVTASSPTMTYGATPPAITATYEGFVNGDSATSLTTKPTCSTTAGSTSPVSGSPYSSSCSGAVDPNYALTYVQGTVVVTRAPLTVTASSGSMTYGGTTPTVTPLYSGFKNGDSASSLTTQATCSTTALSTSTPSPPAYPSSCSGAAGPNYAVSFAAGTITVDPAPLSVTASSGTMAYGGTPPAISPTYSGFVNGDSPSSLTTVATCTTTATGASPVAGSPYASSCGGAVDPDYAFTYVPGVVSVTKVPLTITASDGSMTYGGAPPVITPAYAGFVNGDSASSLTTKPTCSTSATSASPVGAPYPSSCAGAVDANYALTYANGSVTVAPAPLTVTASSPSMAYGGAPPAITPVYSGFKNGDGASSLTTAPTCSTTATSTSTPSPPTYPSSCSGASGVNYSISYVDGATTVTPAPVDVAVAGSQAYGGSPGFTATPPPSLPSGVTGLQASGVTCGEVVPSTAITPTLGAGTYTLVPASCRGASLSGPAAADYAVTYVPGDFSVTGGPPPPPPPASATHGYWLVGSDGGIFTFGSATFHGSTGNLLLQRPVVGITPTSDEGGYWLVASDGGIFAFGDAGFHGSIPGLGLRPAGSGLPNSLDAPIVGMVPSSDGGGYFMVASDGGVFAFGDAQFEGSCPGIGGCSGAAVAVVPDATGRGYWLVTQTGNVYPFGDAPYFGAPGTQGSPVTAAVRTADGGGYFVLLANGTVDGYGDAVSLGGPTGAVGGLDPASAIFTEAGGGGYWVASAAGDVFTYGGAPDDGSMAGTRLNGAVIAGTGF